MTRNELEIREKAVLSAYRDNNIEMGVDYVMRLYERNKRKKLYRFRPPKQREIEAIRKSQIYLCRPRLYEDSGDCEWIDDIEALAKYDVTVRNSQKYRYVKKQITPEKYKEIVDNLKQNPRYIEMKEKVRNMCLVSCITDKMNDYMWEQYTSNSEGICLEYEFEDVLKAIADLNIRFFPVRYVEDRSKTKDIQFGPDEYADDAPDELMERKYILSCMTKSKIPYAKESEWRVLCEDMDDSIKKGKLFDFAKPGKIYLGKNIFKNDVFETGIVEAANELGIPTIYI